MLSCLIIKEQLLQSPKWKIIYEEVFYALLLSICFKTFVYGQIKEKWVIWPISKYCTKNPHELDNKYLNTTLDK